ncbi:MAG: glycosyltransferase family 2 protein, partial [Janthinobacterium lividum]
RWAHTAIGGFDEELLWGEDNDYAFRLWLQLGLTPEWVEEAVVHYRYRTTLRDLRSQANHYSQGLAALVLRYADYWPQPPRPRSAPERAARAALRLMLVRNRSDLAVWNWHLGAAEGYASGLRIDVASRLEN